MAFKDFYTGPPSAFIGDPTPQPFERFDSDIDHDGYVQFLQDACVAARQPGIRADIPADERPPDGPTLPPLPL